MSFLSFSIDVAYNYYQSQKTFKHQKSIFFEVENSKFILENLNFIF
jgi:hypothetical protein